MIEIGGLGNFSATDLSKRLAGKKVSCALSLSQDSENVNGMAAPSDLRTLFELIYLSFTAPRMDEEAYASFETRTKAQLQNMISNISVILVSWRCARNASRMLPVSYSRL